MTSEIEYIVGLDFSDNIATWILPKYDSKMIESSGKPLKLGMTNDNWESMPCRMYFDQFGNYSLFANEYNCGNVIEINHGFVNRHTIQKKHLEEFFKLIIQQILDSNKDILCLNNGNPNFSICLAAPSSWYIVDKLTMLGLCKKAAKTMSVNVNKIFDEEIVIATNIINDNKTVGVHLIIRIEWDFIQIISVEIKDNEDFRIFNIFHGHQLGLNCILEEIYTHPKCGWDEFGKIMEEFNTELKVKGLSNIRLESFLKYEIKKIYCDKIRQQTDIYKLKLDGCDFTGDPCFMKFEFCWKGDLTEISQNYWNNISSLLRKFKSYNPVAVHLIGKTSNLGRKRVLLVREIFNESLFDCSYDPHFVAKGIALYEKSLELNH